MILMVDSIIYRLKIRKGSIEIELFDNIGTLIGVTRKAGLEKDGKIEGLDKALTSDAIGTIASSLLGTSTVTTYVESGAFLTIILMPLTFSIAQGLAFGSMSYVAIKLLTGRAKEVSLIMYVVAIAFVINFYIGSGH